MDEDQKPSLGMSPTAFFLSLGLWFFLGYGLVAIFHAFN